MASRGDLYIQPEHIRTGPWINYNGNAVTGAQLTFTKQDADLLNIFIGIFLVFVEAGLWGLVTFCLFRYNRRRRRGSTGLLHRDGLYHKLQTVLRSSESSLSIAKSYVSIWNAWGRRNPEIIMRTLPLSLIAIVSFLFFVVAMPFITAMALLDDQGIEVLIRSPNCGFWNAPFTSTDTTAEAIMTNQSWEAASYVDNCYQSDVPSSYCDEFLPQRQLRTFAWTAVECPFDVNACLHNNKFPAFEMQTEVLDSHKDFGINAPSNERVKLQRTTVCSPLDVAKFTTITDGVVPGENITGVYFGPTDASDYTFGVSNLEQLATSAYHLSVVSSYPSNGTAAASTFIPIKELTRNNADVSVIFLNNNMIPIKGIGGSCSDPFFSATKQHLTIFPDYFLPDSPVTAIGCTDQYAFGNPATNQWTEPMAVLDATFWGNYTKDWGLSQRQIAAMASIAWAIGQTGAIDRVILGLETEALLAKKYPGVFSGFQNPIPNDQWKKEVSYWFNVGLAQLQLHLIRIAAGPPDTNLPGLQNVLPIVSADKHNLVDLICNSQKVSNGGFKNYHSVGFFFIAALGALLVIGPSVYESYITWRHKQREDVLSWTSYNPLQLLRMVIEGAHVTNWQGCDEETPYLVPWQQAAGDLDANKTDAGKHHPQWQHPDADMHPVDVDTGSGTPMLAVAAGGSGSTADPATHPQPGGGAAGV